MNILYLSFENATIQLFVLHGKSMLFEQPTSIRINFSLAFFFSIFARRQQQCEAIYVRDHRDLHKDGDDGDGDPAYSVDIPRG